jgi:ribose-phosphate pyrophosphokinase
MVDTGGSVESLIRTLAVLNPKEVNIIAVHAIFSPPAEMRLSRLSDEGLLNRIVVTDTAGTSAFSEIIPRLEVVPSAELSAKIIRYMMTNESIGKLMRQFDAEKYLKSPNLFSAQ